MNDLDLIIAAAREAGELALGARENGLKIWSKSGGSPVTDADLAVDTVPTPAEIDHALARLETLAKERGSAVGTASAAPPAAASAGTVSAHSSASTANSGQIRFIIRLLNAKTQFLCEIFIKTIYHPCADGKSFYQKHKK